MSFRLEWRKSTFCLQASSIFILPLCSPRKTNLYFLKGLLNSALAILFCCSFKMRKRKEKCKREAACTHATNLGLKYLGIHHVECYSLPVTEAVGQQYCMKLQQVKQWWERGGIHLFFRFYKMQILFLVGKCFGCPLGHINVDIFVLLDKGVL